MQCSFVEQRNYKVIYRRYASLFFIVGVDGSEVCPDAAFQQLQPIRWHTMLYANELHAISQKSAGGSGC